MAWKYSKMFDFTSGAGKVNDNKWDILYAPQIGKVWKTNNYKKKRLIITIADAELEKHVHFTLLKEDKNEGKNVKRKCEL